MENWLRAPLPVRALATVGVMSYAVLIVNDPLRLVASQLRLEQVSDAVWWTFLVAVYVPISILLAWPLARVLGLLPKGRSYALEPTGTAVTEDSAPPEPGGLLQPEAAGVTARA
jgi:hypothetical protein